MDHSIVPFCMVKVSIYLQILLEKIYLYGGRYQEFFVIYVQAKSIKNHN